MKIHNQIGSFPNEFLSDFFSAYRNDTEKSCFDKAHWKLEINAR